MDVCAVERDDAGNAVGVATGNSLGVALVRARCKEVLPRRVLRASCGAHNAPHASSNHTCGFQPVVVSFAGGFKGAWLVSLLVAKLNSTMIPGGLFPTRLEVFPWLGQLLALFSPVDYVIYITKQPQAPCDLRKLILKLLQ